MRVVVAPDKFEGSLSAGQAAAAIEAGLRQARPDVEVVRLPLGDGGASGTGFLSEKRRMELPVGPGANGPSTLTFIGTARPLSARRGSSRCTRSHLGVRPAR